MPENRIAAAFDRLPPQNLDAEKGVLGSVLLVNDTIDDFGHEIEKYPRIASATALAVGLALGYFIGRQVR